MKDIDYIVETIHVGTDKNGNSYHIIDSVTSIKTGKILHIQHGNGPKKPNTVYEHEVTVEMLQLLGQE